MNIALAVILVQGFLSLTVSPPPGEHYQGDGHAVVSVVSDSVAIVDAVFEGVSLLLPAHVKGTLVANSVFRGSRQNTRGCYYGGGQAIMIANEKGNPRKLIINNRVEDYDCIAYSLYNHGPVHNVSIIGNQDDGGTRDDFTWAVLGPKDNFSDLSLIQNEFTGWVSIGHRAYMAKARGVLLSGNIFHRVVFFSFSRDSSGIVDCENEYGTVVWRQGHLPTRSRTRNLCSE